jgi:hypothetical protein
MVSFNQGEERNLKKRLVFLHGAIALKLSR